MEEIMSRHRTRLLLRAACAVALASLLGAPRPAQALFHVAVIDEFVSSYGGDPNAQFVEIRMLIGAQNFVANSLLVAFDASGNFLGTVYTVPTNVNQGAGLPWIMATQEFVDATGYTPDFTIPTGGLRLPADSGMVCWGEPGVVIDNPVNYVDCVAYGAYSGPSNVKTGTPTPLDPDGHSLQRVAYGSPGVPSHDNLTDYACSTTLTPASNTGNTMSLPATTPCPVCGNNVVEPGEQCDGTDNTLCPGQCLGNCHCQDTDGDGTIDVQDACTTTDTHQEAQLATIVLNKLDMSGGNGMVVKGTFKPAVTTPSIDPSINGAHLRLTDSVGVLYDLNVRGDAAGSSPCADARDGWTKIAKPNGITIWKYKNKSGELPPGCAAGSARGLSDIMIKDLTATPAAAWKFLAKTKMDTLPHAPAVPVFNLQFDLSLAQEATPGTASAAEQAGECTELTFSGLPVHSIPPKPYCKRAPASGTLKTLTCHGV
jgi:hypothetical protein